MGLLLHCGSSRVEQDALKAVPVPEYTSTWYPMPYYDMVNEVKRSVTTNLGPIKGEAYGLSKSGDQMFALLHVDSEAGPNDMGVSIGLRSSYNKSIAPGVVCGSRVLVCDNLCFSGDAFRLVRKNTKNVWEDFCNLLAVHVYTASSYHSRMSIDRQHMEQQPVSEQRGYEILGRALGNNCLTATQATVAFEDWKTPRHSQFGPRNLWSLYNCVTEGLKRGSVGSLINRHVAAHDFFMGQRQCKLDNTW